MIRIDIFADIVCPWCYIGERRLLNALEQRPDIEVERHWQPFQLQPDLPPEGMDWREFRKQRFGETGESGDMFQHITQTGKEVGLDFHFERITRMPNTIDAHRLILVAASQDREWEAVDALYRANFTEGKDLNDLDVLTGIAAGIGMDPDQTRQFLESDAGVDVVRESQQAAAQLGISGVPFFIFNSQYAVSGAQPEEVFLQVFDKVQEDVAAD